MASSALIWQLVKDRHAFQVKNSGRRLTREPGALDARPTQRNSVFANRAIVDLRPAADGRWVLTTTSPKAALAAKPKRRQHTVLMRRCSFKKLSRAVANAAARQAHRPELVRPAVRRAAILWRAFRRESLAKAAAAKAAKAAAAAPAPAAH